MAVRPRRKQQPRKRLTLHRYIDLTLGPFPAVDAKQIDILRAVFEEHRDRFEPDDWCVQYWEQGHDTRDQGPDEVAAVERRLAEGEDLGPHALERAVGLPGSP